MPNRLPIPAIVAVLAIVFGLWRIVAFLVEDPPPFSDYEERIGMELGALVSELSGPGRVIVLVPDYDGGLPPHQQARLEGLGKRLAKESDERTVVAQPVRVDPMNAQTGRDVFGAGAFLDALRAWPEGETSAVVSLVGPPGGLTTLQRAWSDRHPPVIVLAVYDESVGQLMKAGIVHAAITPRSGSREDVDVSQWKDPHQARFHREYQVRR